MIARLTGYQNKLFGSRAKSTKIDDAKLIGSKRIDERSNLNKVIYNDFVHQSQDSQLPKKSFFANKARQIICRAFFYCRGIFSSHKDIGRFVF